LRKSERREKVLSAVAAAKGEISQYEKGRVSLRKRGRRI